jgi:hypothetical protein
MFRNRGRVLKHASQTDLEGDTSSADGIFQSLGFVGAYATAFQFSS